MTRGLFITLEGGEGGGKSTQARLLAGALRTAGKNVLLTREPGGASGAEAIRELLVQGAVGRWDGVTEALLHSAARRDHLVKTVWPALEAGQLVISDRFADSTLAYQGYGHGVDRTILDALYRAIAGDFRPDLTLILDIPVEIGLARAAARSGSTQETRYESMAQAFHQRLRDGFHALAAAEPQRCRIIDATRGVEAIHADIVAVTMGVCALLERKSG